MIRVDGTDHWTVREAAAHFGVTSKTVHEWIKRGLVERPPRARHGLRTTAYFPQEWIAKAETVVDQYGRSGTPSASR